MLISIIIPIYNVEQYIENCLISVVSQTYSGDIECIVVNDATPDNSYLLAQKFVNNYKGRVVFRLIEHQRNLGLSEARNTGLVHALGEYVLFLDSDDTLPSNALEELTTPLKQCSYDFVLGSYAVSFSDTNLQRVIYTERPIFSTNSIRNAYVKGEWNVTAWNKLCNREFLINNGLYFKKGLIHEDDLWSLQLSNSAKSMYILSACTYIYYARENSILAIGRQNVSLQINRKIILFCAMQDYVYGLSDYVSDNYFYLEKKYINILNDIYEHRGKVAIKPLYEHLHKSYKLKHCLLNKSLLSKIKILLRDAHFLMPSLMGFYLWLLYRFLFQRVKD